MSSRQQPIGKSPEMEWILNDPEQSFRWHEHDYSHESTRWNYHPEFEIHLIRHSSGKAFVGDSIREFGPGYLALVGPNIPHDWVSNVGRKETVRLRSAVLQFDGDMLQLAMSPLPELRDVSALLGDASRGGIEFHGKSAQQAAMLMEEIGIMRPGLSRLLLFLSLMQVLANTRHRTILSRADMTDKINQNVAEVIHKTISYIMENISGGVRMSYAAGLAGMSETAFSRFFKRGTGNNFVDCVRHLRIAQACRLLRETNMTITNICFQVGYQNISNFNRHFLAEREMTPSQYRRMADANALGTTTSQAFHVDPEPTFDDRPATFGRPVQRSTTSGRSH